MSIEDELREDAEVAEMAVAALQAAQDRAMNSGRPVVLMIGDQLVEKSAAGTRVLETLSPLITITCRTKRVDN